MIDTSIDAANYPQLCPYPYIRLAEMYLIAAEACTELNQLDEAAAFLDVLRARTGRPDTKATLNIRKNPSIKRLCASFSAMNDARSFSWKIRGTMTSAAG